MNTFFQRLTLIMCLATLPGCVRNRDYLKRFPRMPKETSFVETKEEVTVQARAYSPKECEEYFGVDLIEEGYLPIQVRIENESNKRQTLRAGYISMELTPTNRVAKQLHYNTSMITSISSMLLFPLYWIGIPSFVAPGAYAMYKSNRKMNDNLRYNGINRNDVVEVPPFMTVNKFIFVAYTDFSPVFGLRVFNEDDKKLIPFTITLTPPVDLESAAA